jgi:parvulin-like peptidyl-prolyl isomerase
MGLIVNGEKIEDLAIQREVERLRLDYEKTFRDQQPQEREAQLLEWSRENVIENTLLRQEAKKYGGQVSGDEVEALLARLKKQYDGEAEFYKDFGAKDDEKAKEIIRSILRLDRFFDDICKDVPEPSKDAVLEFYEENKEQFTSDEEVRVAHIVKHISGETDEATAYAAIMKTQGELENGVIFETLVTRYSDCPENGGDLGYITKGEMVEEFEDVVFNLGVGEVSRVFRSRFGFHIAKVYDRKPAVIHPLKEVKEQVIDELKEQMRNKVIYEFIDRLKDKAKIEEV